MAVCNWVDKMTRTNSCGCFRNPQVRENTERWCFLKRKRRSPLSGQIAAWAIVIILLPLAASISQAGPPKIKLGWNGACFAGRWAPIVVELSHLQQGSLQLHVTSPDPDGHRVTYLSPVVSFSESASETDATTKTLRGYCKLGRPVRRFAGSEASTKYWFDPEIEVHVTAEDSSEPVIQWNSTTVDASSRPKLLKAGTRLVVTIGNPRGFPVREMASSLMVAEENGSTTTPHEDSMSVVETEVEELPVDALGYDGVSLLVFAGSKAPSSAQSAALRDWIVQGGRVVISLPSNPEDARKMLGPLSSWVPMTIDDEPMIVHELSLLEKYAGRNIRIPIQGRKPIPAVRAEEGVVLVGDRDNAIVLRLPYGFGSVTMISLDLTRPPLSEWSAVDSLGRTLLNDVTSSGEIRNDRNTKRAQLSSTGITDIGTQLHAIQDEFKGVTRSSLWLAMGVMGLLLLAIGPMDYLLVHVILRRPHATWITFPLWIAGAAVFTAYGASLWNGTTQRVNQFQLINIDAKSSAIRTKLWTNIYSPQTISLSTVQMGTSLSKSHSLRESSPGKNRSSWSGVAESAFGGIYRTSGIEMGRSHYSQSPEHQLNELPVVQWSSKSLLTEETGSATSLVSSELVGSLSGRLTGTLTHRLPGTIEDWFLAYGNRVYRQSKSRDDPATISLASRQLWRVEQPNVFQRDLRSFLIGQVTVAIRQADSNLENLSHRQTTYDPLSLNAQDLARALTFHEESGGTKYTGLTNRLLSDEDLSHLLKLNRAILFGRLKGAASSVQISASKEPSQDVTPNREFTFVRIVLPVTKIREVPRQLESLDPDKL